VSVELLRLSQARIDIGGAPLFDGVECTTSADRVLLIGAWQPLFRLFARQATLASGSALVHGQPAETVVRDGSVGLVLADSRLPLAWRGVDYLRESALLAGLGRHDARRTAITTLERLGVPGLGTRRISELTAVERRVLLLGHALLSNPTVLALDEPLSGLDEWSQSYALELIERAAVGRRLLCSSAELRSAGPGRTLVDRAAELVVLEAGKVTAQGPPEQLLAPSRRYRVTVVRRWQELVARLTAHGVSVSASAAGTEPVEPQSARLWLELPEGATPDLVLKASVEVEAPVIELVETRDSLAPPR
jgi:ABC-type multidrug transport system ATPase subunit